MTIQPLARLAVWLLTMIAIFSLSVAAGSVIAVMLLALGGRSSALRFVGLIRRSKWLLVAILLATSLSVPGEYLLPGVGLTREGLAQSGLQIARLIAALAALSWLLQANREQLLAALLGLGAVFSIGREPAPWVVRSAIRIALVLELLENSKLHWRDLLAANSVMPGRNTVEITVPTIDGWNLGLIFSAVAMLGLVLAWSW